MIGLTVRELECGLSLALALAISSCLYAQSPSTSDWPNMRGPSWDGISQVTGIVNAWGKEGPPILWTRELGQGYSSFIAWENRVATQYQNLAGQYVLCLEAETGKTLWQYRYGMPFDPVSLYPGPRSTPCFSDGFVYFTTPDGRAGCLAAESGTAVWMVDLYAKFGGTVPGFGYACSPIVVDEHVILPVGGKGASLVALNKRDGTLKWKSGDDPASYTPVLPITFEGRSLVIGYLQNYLVCHDVETGERQWRRSLSSGYDEHSAWPLYKEPYLWISGPFQRGSELLKLTGNPADPIVMVRSSRLMSNDIFSSVLHDDCIYGFDLQEAQAKIHRTSRGIFRCIDLRSGEPHWSVGTGGVSRVGVSDSSNPEIKNVEPSRARASAAKEPATIGHATVLVADNKLILFNDMGDLILAVADPRRYEELARASVLPGELSWTQPCLSQQRIFVRNHSRAACVFLGNAATLNKATLANAKRVEDIPHAKYQDWAARILSIEPEYLFDIRSMETYKAWYGCSMVIFLLSAILVWSTRCLLPPQASFQPPGFSTQDRFLFWTISILLGAAGTTWLSKWTSEFVFTWPVCLYATWHITTDHLSFSYRRSAQRTGWVSIFSLVGWIAACVFYFFLCRRLSLLFELVFLTGFVSALPFNLCGRNMACD
ncbi:MAG: PQQ-binding-like beta-propeller repeat protein, partial [Pirellula sp.]